MKLHSGIILSLMLLCVGCSKRQDTLASLGPATADAPVTPAMTEAEPAVEPADKVAFTPPSPVPSPVSRLRIYHARLRVKAHSVPRASRQLDSLVRRSGGYVSAATESREDGEWRTETTIRVAPARFQGLLTGLSELGTVEEKTLSTDDVTAEHADVAARLRTKRAIEARYVALLAKAQRIKDVLDVEAKVGEVREEIEATESRLKALDDEVAYSTITLSLYQPLAVAVPDAPVVSLGSRMVEAFYGGWQLLTSLLVGMVAIWPLALPGALGIWLWRYRRIRPRAVIPVAEERK